ncbi:hypothetical protein HGRIS_008781 [Hohenbuehelia grisea]|uniref:Uncharacterized protein n=1 Tax=Hohenbuehelia grisea TaxID=104357 RepID=A0ABR3J9L1_9AGAR
METNTTDIEYFPTAYRKPPPTKLLGSEDGVNSYTWFITKDEYLRLCKIFGREFEETNLGATRVVGLPAPCTTCGKYTEFIDWSVFKEFLCFIDVGSLSIRVWTALRRKVHTSDFMFEALKDRRMPKENMHDVYCSECGTLTQCRSRNNAEGGAPNILEAGRLRNADYPAKTAQDEKANADRAEKPAQVARWYTWWLDDNGSTKAWRDAMKAGKIKEQATVGSH